MRARWAGIAVAALVLAGCGGIPSAGPVETGEIIDEATEIDVGFSPVGPQPGDSQTLILQGFINAATNPQENYGLARSFLSESIRESWDPNAITQIRNGVGAVRPESDTAATYSLTSSAHVNDRGQYVEDEPATQVLNFSFEKDDSGEWRISAAPPGIVLSRASFNSIFEAHPLYYFDPSNRYLIPDLRWFARTSSLPTRVVRALLGGQSAWLQQGVTNTYFPTGTEVASSVTVNSGVATVALSDQTIDATPEQVERMRQQLRDTIGNVSSVIITVNGVTLNESDATVSPATIDPGVESHLLVRQDDSIGFLGNSGKVSGFASQQSELVDLGATDFTLARDGKHSAALAPDGVYLVSSGDAPPLRVDNRRGLLAPSIDNDGFVWTMPASNAAAILAVDGAGVAHAISAPQLSGMRAVSFSLSRDGARVLVLTSTALGPRLSVFGIVRADGVPTQLGPQLSLPIDQTSRPIDASWVDDNSVSTLSVLAGDTASTVALYELGGPAQAIGSVEGGVSIVGGNGGSDGLRVVTSEGEVFKPRGNGWADTGIALAFIATQQ